MTKNQRKSITAILFLGVAVVGFWFTFGASLWDDYQQDQVLDQLESVVGTDNDESTSDSEETAIEAGEVVEPAEATTDAPETEQSTTEPLTTEPSTTTDADDVDETTTSVEDQGVGETTTSTTTTTTEAETTTTTEEPGPARAGSFEIIETLEHDVNAFTQGLEISDGRLFESTGLVGESTIRELDIETGNVIRSTSVQDVFSEGLTIVGNTAIQLTWQEEEAYRYDLDTFEVIETYTYDGEGWGLCNAAQGSGNLVMSDGSSELEFRDPDTFESLGTIEVLFDGSPVENLNELECVGDSVWANIWLTDLIIEIDPSNGAVLTVIDAAELRPESTTNSSGAVLNGLAYDFTTDTMLVTGKLWPVIYRLELN